MACRCISLIRQWELLLLFELELNGLESSPHQKSFFVYRTISELFSTPRRHSTCHCSNQSEQECS